MDNFEIKILTDDYAEETLKLFNRVFGLTTSMELWKEKHFENPVGNSIFFGAFDNDKLIAMNAFMPMQYVYKNELYNVVESCESAVSPNYRNRGIFSKIIKYAETWLSSNNYDFIIGFPNINSYPVFMKLGWEVVEVTEHFGQIVSLRKWIEKKKESSIRPLTDTLFLINYIKNLFVNPLKNNYQIHKMKVDEFLLEYYKNNDIIKNNYGENWLQWRLGNNGQILSVSDENRVILIFIILDNTILYLDSMGNETCDVVDALRYFVKKGLNRTGEVTIYINRDSELINKIHGAGFVNKREPQQTKIVKRLSMRAITMNKDVRWLDQIS